MFIQTEATGDPARLKFLPGQPVLPRGTLEIHDAAGAARSPLAQALFAVEGVAGLTLGSDFVTVTKRGGDWAAIKPAILEALMGHFLSGAPTVLDPPPGAGDGDDPLAAQVRQALKAVIDPELGYNIVDLGLIYDVVADEGAVMRVTMTTTTPGCPATNYLKDGTRECTLAVEGVSDVEVILTHEPRWSPEMMSDEAKTHFGIS